jgi:hypothetical protein
VVAALAPPTKKSDGVIITEPYQSRALFAGTVVALQTNSVPAVLAPVAPNQRDTVAGVAVLFTTRRWVSLMTRLLYGALVELTPPVVVPGLSRLVVVVVVRAIGPNLNGLAVMTPHIP